MITPRLNPRLQATAAGILVLGCTLPVGCSRQLDAEKYGEVIVEMPKIEGADQPYPLPQLQEPAKTPNEAGK